MDADNRHVQRDVHEGKQTKGTDSCTDSVRYITDLSSSFYNLLKGSLSLFPKTWKQKQLCSTEQLIYILQATIIHLQKNCTMWSWLRIAVYLLQTQLSRLSKQANVRKLLTVFRSVNQSWGRKNIKQKCKADIVEIGDNWDTFCWPSSVYLRKNKGINLTLFDQKFKSRRPVKQNISEIYNQGDNASQDIFVPIKISY